MKELNLETQLPSVFEMIAGSVSLDFVNTLDDRPTEKPKELLKTYYDLVKFGQEAGILTIAQLDYLFENVHLRLEEAEQALRRARELREALHDIFWALIKKNAAPRLAINTLNHNLHDAALHSRLASQGGRFEWRFDDLTSSFEGVLWPIARAAADLLASTDAELVRACSAPTCQWLFLDTSKNHHRRWCSMKLCGNRSKVRKFYERKREGAENR
ncbi:MAG: CGNR zinc finger domain-containing protein [Candidatus Sulfotelmatobacter sp.]